ncbi:hypothetical protein EJB05_41547, partial [Eragrostis curvula]
MEGHLDPRATSEKIVADLSESTFALALPDADDVLFLDLDEFLVSSSDESTTAGPRAATRNTNGGPPPASGSYLGPKILSRSSPNWYQVFYIRIDRGGSFHMYPDLGGPFQSVDEADGAINWYLDELRRQGKPKEQAASWTGWCVLVDFYLDGTPKRGPNSPRGGNNRYDGKRYLIKALLDQYNEHNNLSGDLAYELEDLVEQQLSYEDHRWYYHFNFTTKRKDGGNGIIGNPSAGNMFFAEVSHMQGENALEVSCCCAMDAKDNGHCYGCINNGSPGMRHPSRTDAYNGGHRDGYLPFGLDLVSSSDDEEDEEGRLRYMFEDLDDPDVWDSLFPPNEASTSVAP